MNAFNWSRIYVSTFCITSSLPRNAKSSRSSPSMLANLIFSLRSTTVTSNFFEMSTISFWGVPGGIMISYNGSSSGIFFHLVHLPILIRRLIIHGPPRTPPIGFLGLPSEFMQRPISAAPRARPSSTKTRWSTGLSKRLRSMIPSRI
jgi:hypothetical protein